MAKKMRYKMDVLKALRDKSYNTNILRKECLLTEGVIQSLRNRKPISWRNICKVCILLNCQPCDLLEVVDVTGDQFGGKE